MGDLIDFTRFKAIKALENDSNYIEQTNLIKINDLGVTTLDKIKFHGYCKSCSPEIKVELKFTQEGSITCTKCNTVLEVLKFSDEQN